MRPVPDAVTAVHQFVFLLPQKQQSVLDKLNILPVCFVLGVFC